MDVIALHQAGFDNAVATLGTALTPEQTRLISQYTNSVVIAYDSDGAGQAATKRAINMFSDVGVHVKVLTIQMCIRDSNRMYSIHCKTGYFAEHLCHRLLANF